MEIMEKWYVYAYGEIQSMDVYEKFPRAHEKFKELMENPSYDNSNLFMGFDYSLDGENIIGSIDALMRIDGKLKLGERLDTCKNSLVRINVKNILKQKFEL